MNVLLLGSGGREHAIAWKLSKSPLLHRLFIAPGNAGTGQTGTNVELTVSDFQPVGRFCLENNIHMVVVGPEDPLVNGISDFFGGFDALKHIAVIGPAAAGSRLEGSKDFAKEFMGRHGIPTAAYRTFTRGEYDAAVRFLETLQAPYVIKADGLAAGKGVIIAESVADAEEALRSMLIDDRFGKAGNKVVIEEFLTGIEVSIFVLTDGESYVLLPEAKDYKRIGEGDTGPNTGGMGSISPVPFVDDTFRNKMEERIIRPTIAGLKKEGIPYKGFVFFGLMNVKGDPYVIEYNVRLGDPETESILRRLETDLLELFVKTAEGSLNQAKVQISPKTAAAVMLVSGGYPGDYTKGKSITGLDLPGDAVIFHAGTALADGQTVTAGGRVLAVTAVGATLQEALGTCYEAAAQIRFEGMYYRKDLGFDL